jgi:hypothetical protein
MHSSCDTELLEDMRSLARVRKFPMLLCEPCEGTGEFLKRDAALDGGWRADRCITCQGYGVLFQVGRREMNVPRLAQQFP